MAHALISAFTVCAGAVLWETVGSRVSKVLSWVDGAHIPNCKVIRVSHSLEEEQICQDRSLI